MYTFINFANNSEQIVVEAEKKIKLKGRRGGLYSTRSAGLSHRDPGPAVPVKDQQRGGIWRDTESR